MSDCEACNNERVLSYHGECCLCADCSDDLKLYDYIQEIKQQLKEAERLLGMSRKCSYRNQALTVDGCHKIIGELEQQLKDANDKLEEINSYVPKVGESSYAMVVKQLKEADEVIEFYSQGGNSNRDIWYDDKLGYFIGKKAREYKKKWSEK
jgi:hypothetical protein